MADPAAGQQDPSDSVGGFNPISFAIQQALARISTIKIVKVIAVDTGAHTVDVQIAVNQLDGNNNSTPHGTIFSVPYMWSMGGTNAFQVDPAVGDMGLMSICDRDISSVKNTKAIANPGSGRKFDAADGIYLFGIPGLNGTAPTQWIKWTADGVDIKAAHGNELTSDAGGWKFTGPVTFNDTVDAKAAITAETTLDVKGIATLESNLQLGGSFEGVAGGVYPHALTINGVVSATDLYIAGHAAYTVHQHSYLVPTTSSGGGDTGTPN